MFKRIVFSAIILTASTTAFANPELLSPDEADLGHFQLIETIEIKGDIDDSIAQLIDKSLENKNGQFYAIDTIKEDIKQETLTLVIKLYNEPAGMMKDQLAA
ncbi:hypothetical protein L6J37_10390 [Photobacterium sp. WH77]|uniref:DUF1471 domain-containing protein n=1 Tax=Photobacterium arenosum TaxID=2774143 RepID=A0ABR9BNV8_9GAMM|nr:MULTISPECIES: hypothetical protein [Photobacterium]MBD8514247.1 hypothetical protein [Photobacterium arenosum]MCG2837242.1 hypothetical protein [Photobacterium sp. WH77]MCG2844858.1 hypothetical protein [Photobacterium sp. WH80]MDO6581452.1 hypothetical protein [Photobacterium sp. 2_MG-2023]